MNLADALKEIELLIASRGSAKASSSKSKVLEALECVETTIPPSSNKAMDKFVHNRDNYDYDESEYAVEVALSLSKRYDPYFTKPTQGPQRPWCFN